MLKVSRHPAVLGLERVASLALNDTCPSDVFMSWCSQGASKWLSEMQRRGLDADVVTYTVGGEGLGGCKNPLDFWKGMRWKIL